MVTVAAVDGPAAAVGHQSLLSITRDDPAARRTRSLPLRRLPLHHAVPHPRVRPSSRLLSHHRRRIEVLSHLAEDDDDALELWRKMSVSLSQVRTMNFGYSDTVGDWQL